MSHMNALNSPIQGSAPEFLASAPYRLLMANPATRTRFALGAAPWDFGARGQMVSVSAISNQLDQNQPLVSVNLGVLTNQILILISTQFPDIINRAN